MRSPSSLARYRAEAAHALSRLQHYRAGGDALRTEQWHRAWSLAAEAEEAESRQSGAGAAVQRRGTPSGLRPLPPAPEPHPVAAAVEIAGARAPEIAPSTPAPMGPHLPTPEEREQFAAALERHGRIERALRAGGPNPLPDELGEGEWQYHLTAYRDGGPLECELLLSAEASIDAMVEQRPELLPPEDEEGYVPAWPDTLPVALEMPPECLRIYRESLADLSEAELRADWETCLQGGRSDTAAVIEAELQRRERDTTPEPLPVVGRELGGRSADTDQRKVVNTTAESPVTPQICETGVVVPLRDRVSGADPPPAAARSKPPRRRAAVYSTSSPVTPPAAPRSRGPVPCEESVPTASPAAPAYTTAPAWIDTAGRTRTWSILAPDGAKLAESTTKQGAEKLAALLNGVLNRPAAPAP